MFIKTRAGLFLVAVCLELALPSALAYFEKFPRLITKEGNLILEPGINRNFTIRLNGRSRLLVNDYDMMDIMINRRILITNSSNAPIDNLKLQSLLESVNTLQNQIFSRGGLKSRLDILHNRTQSMNLPLLSRRIQRRISAMENRITSLNRRLEIDNCQSNPCENGGTCLSFYNAFKCKCLKGFEGPKCATDVNECTLYAGTELGCQNGAQCINQYGSYTCICNAGWQGIHCNQRKTDCLHASSTELCGHGTCVNSNDNFGYRCICEQGWKTNGLTPACNVDVDECQEFLNSCSTKCINLPGGFMCAPCEAGLTGNGLVCKDIDECASDNGGCSVAPFVPCINSFGSFHCGECPIGWIGDGRVCTRSTGTSCTENICHPKALCREISNRIVCQCPEGMVGSGVGPNGCMPMSVTTCSPNPCRNGGICMDNGNGTHTCVCPVGFRLPNCERSFNPCDANPCRNGGSCRVQGSSFSCTCIPGYVGRLCDQQRSRCGEYITANDGVLKYPPGSEYNHNAQCSWVIRVDANKVLNITFTMFDIEDSMECRFDWLQIHDGPTAASQLIGRFCGSRAPLGGNIITTSNRIYLWFKSDNSTAKAGFALSWTSIDPVCGGVVEFDSHTTIASPGSPGNYPPNRSCQWHLKAPNNKRMRLVFFNLKIESHADCDHDFLEITDAISKTRLEIFCNSSSPSPLTVPSNEILINFHSDSEGSDLGFQIFVSTVERIPGCGGTYTDRQGEISSPSGFEGLLSCEYFVRHPKYMRIQLEVTEFNMGEEDCIEIFEIVSLAGNKTASGRWCGKMNVPLFNSMGNEVQINFYSKGGTFKMSYRSFCHYKYEEPSGVIKSPNYPTSYHNDETCTFEIIGESHQVVSLEFVDFDIEGSSLNDDCLFDFVVIDDGSNATAAGPFCGTAIPAKIISSTSWLKITLKSDKNTAGRGFMANYTLIGTNENCGGVLRKPSGEIRYPKIGDRYNNDMTCIWTIFAPENYGIQLSWISFNLEHSTDCLYDFVEIYDTEKLSSANQGLGRFCGTTMPPAIVSASSVLTLKFVSDSSETMDGFIARYTFLDTTTLCGGNIFSSTGTIKSPDFPYDYPNNIDCKWTVSVQPSNQMELIVKVMDLEESANCTNDWLEIRNGGSARSPLIGKYCGKVIPTRFSTFTHQIYINFKTNAQIGKKGFHIEWQTIASGCGGVIKADHGSVASPFYPQHYNNEAQCEWSLTVTVGSTILIKFEDVSMESVSVCEYDNVDIYDGLTTDRTRLVRLCEMPSDIIETTGNNALIRFQTDSSSTERGFYLTFVSNCNRSFNATHGVIESPNFGDNNPSEVNCSWTIRAPKGNRIILEFDVVGHKDQGDLKAGVVYVREGKNNTVTKVISPKRYEFQADLVQISLNSSTTYFRMEYAIRGCVGTFNRDTGEFTSPQYPQLYPNNMGCLWYIETDFGKAIKVVFTEIDIEQSVNCTKDSIQIWNMDRKMNSISKLCGKRQNVTVTSSGNVMYIEFNSDAQENRKGFKANYTVIPATCGGVLAFSPGTITSPNYPNNYDSNLHCEWLIEASEHSTLNITVEELDVENSHRCHSDWLAISDGGMPSQAENFETKTFCGSDVPAENVILTTSSRAKVEFHTDADVEFKGFKLSFKENCGKRIEINETGRIRFQGSDDTKCSWIFIAADRSSHVTFTTTHSAMRPLLNIPEDECNGVMIFDGDFQNSTRARPRARFCAHHPQPYTSFGHALTITLDPQIISEFEGFYSLMENTCGGEFTSLRGTFASPSYPIAYPVNVECIWTIVASAGNALSLNIHRMELELSDDCNKDYLEVRDGSSSGSLLKVLCGSDVPPTITGSHSLWIKFKSDDNYVGKGFIASYSYAIDSEVNGTDGVIESPRFPDLFTSLTDHSWRITVPRLKRIFLTFSYFARSYEDFIKIYNGYDEQAEEIELTEDKTIRSSTNFLYLKASKGIFRLNWYQVSAEFMAENRTTINSPWNCSNNIIEVNLSTVVFKSPGFPTGYESNMNCSWILVPVNYGSHATVAFTAIDLENDEACTMDRVVVSSSYDMATWRHMGTKCKLGPSEALAFEGDRFLKVEFLTDYGVNGTGFRASTTSVCGSILTEPSGFINTKNYKTLAMFRFGCTWMIRVKTGRRIKITFDESNFSGRNDSSGTCVSYLLLKNGFSEHSPNLGRGRYCDNNFGDIPITSSNEAYIKVKFERRQSEMPWVSFRYEEVMNNCEHVIELDDAHPWATVKSENYPNIPHAHSTCVWRVKAPLMRSIQVDFTEKLQMKQSDICELEYVELLDGSTTLAPLIGRFCGISLPNSQHSSGNLLRITHFTDIAEPNVGFIANVSLSLCGGTYRQSQGTISSPKLLNLLPVKKGFSCDYLISLPDSNDVDLTIESLNLPKASNCTTVNHLAITLMYDDEDSNIYLTRCGSSSNQNFILEASRILIRLVIVSPIFDRDIFRISYSGIGHRCSEVIESTEGVLKSPGYLKALTIPKRCVWKLKVPKGQRIKLEIMESKVSENTTRIMSPMSESVIISNDWEMRSVIGRYKSLSPGTVVYSTDNLMVIFSFERPSSQKAGFKLQFSSEEETLLCNANFQPFQGTVRFEPPGDDTAYCRYDIDVGKTETIALSLEKMDAFVPKNFLCARYSPIMVHDKANKYHLQQLCLYDKNNSIIRLPFPGVLQFLKTRHNSLKSLELKFARHSCGGVFTIGNRFTLTAPVVLQENYGAMDCAWQVLPNPGDLEQFEITLSVDFKLNCDEQYLIVHTSSLMNSPHMGRFCKQEAASDLVVVSGVFIEYHTAAYESGSSFNLTASVGAGCGGSLSFPYREIEFRKQYQNNVECVWTVAAGKEYHIGLSFSGRFYIESSDNCTKDYLLVQEQSKPDVWVDLYRLCGRNVPVSVNTTTDAMRLVFRSDESGTGDGFTANFERNCGNELIAGKDVQQLSSPNYPLNYDDNLNCTYKILPAEEGKSILLQIIDFTLEDTVSGECEFDSLTVYLDTVKTAVLCGNNRIEEYRSSKPITLVFKTDSSFKRKGFLLQYSTEQCGGNITNTTTIATPKQKNDGRYPHNAVCTWNIVTPVGFKILVKFEKFEFEGSVSCSFDYVEVYSGLEMARDQKVARLCGNLTGKIPPLSIKSNLGLIQSVSDQSEPSMGFSAVVRILKMCDKTIELKSLSDSYTLNDFANGYENDLDCGFLFTTTPGQRLEVQFTSFHVEDSEKCDKDYLQIMDGAGLFADEIAKLCGHKVPYSIMSSRSKIFLHFVSDASTTSSGFSATIRVNPLLCGANELSVNVSSPVTVKIGGSGNYQPNLNCMWRLRSSGPMQLDFQSFDVQGPNANGSCSTDYVKVYIKLDLWMSDSDTMVYSGDNVHRFIELEGENYLHYVYCGQTLPGGLYVNGREAYVRFFSDSSIERRGFELKASQIAGCRKNYTSTQGRIRIASTLDCETFITAPVNHSLSVYFDSSSRLLSSTGNCSEFYTEFFDMNDASKSGRSIRKICGGAMETVDSVFTNTNKLRIFTSTKDIYKKIEMTFLASDKGPGCGGDLYNTVGVFTSPFYPEEVRNSSDCRWNIRVPHNYVVQLQFRVFDMGSKVTCNSDYLEIIENSPADEVVRKYCGEDEPAVYTGLRNTLSVRFRKTLNFAGIGWVIRFRGIHDGYSMF